MIIFAPRVVFLLSMDCLVFYYWKLGVGLCLQLNGFDLVELVGNLST